MEKPDFFIAPEKAPRFSQMEGLETMVLKGERMMMALNATLPGHTVPMHSHLHEQVGMVYAGEAILRVGGEKRRVRKGDLYCIPADVPHGNTTIGDGPFVMLDVFYPIGEDFVEKCG